MKPHQKSLTGALAGIALCGLAIIGLPLDRENFARLMSARLRAGIS